MKKFIIRTTFCEKGIETQPSNVKYIKEISGNIIEYSYCVHASKIFDAKDDFETIKKHIPDFKIWSHDYVLYGEGDKYTEIRIIDVYYEDGQPCIQTPNDDFFMLDLKNSGKQYQGYYIPLQESLINDKPYVRAIYK